VGHGFLRGSDGSITTYNVPGAGTAAGQGTYTADLNAFGVIAGEYADVNNAWHGYLGKPGSFTTFDVPGDAQGTFPQANTSWGAVTGAYADANGVSHGFLRIP
jgi:hypothetical protein